MTWQVVTRPQAEDDVIEAADWYDTQRAGLGDEFIEEILVIFDALQINPLLHLPPSSYQEHQMAISETVSLSSDL